MQPRLRMIYNGDDEVNARRASFAAAVARTATRKLSERHQATLPDWKEPARDVRVSTFLELRSATSRLPGSGADSGSDSGPGERCVVQHGKLATADLSLERLRELAGEPGIVSYISAGETLEAPNPTSRAFLAQAPAPRAVDPGAPSGRVLLGIVDVGGFDFGHPDFLQRRRTRFERIWDQGLRPEKPGRVPYGDEITRRQIDEALRFAAGPDGLPATEVLTQSMQVPGSHATHVASIAGGNLGVCPGAVLAGVTISIPTDEEERSRSFFDSTRLAHAVDWLDALATELDLPLVINVSLGTNGHAHDGSSPISRWIERLLDDPGRCVVVAAGNAGQEAPTSEGDLGFLSGRVHSSGRIEANGLEVDLEWEVLGGDDEDLSENEMEIWYEPQDEFEVLLRPPGASEWVGPVGGGRYVQNRLLANGTLVSIYNERYHPANGAHRISVFLSPRLLPPVGGVRAGLWTVRLRGRTIRDGRFHAWIERDDPRPVRAIGETRASGRVGWGFPSVFSAASNVDRCSVSSLGCSERVVAVANYDPVVEKVHPSSSQGPTRRGVSKPEVAAVGTDVVAANGFGRPRHPWISKTGTSMASPWVAGVAAAMLAREPRLNASQIIGIMRRTAQPLPGHDYEWQDGAGFGRIQPQRCLEELAATFTERDVDEPGAPPGAAS